MLRLNFFTLLLFIFLGQTTSIQATNVPWKKNRASGTSARLVLSSDHIAPTMTQILGGIEFKLSDGWHIYWKNPREVGLRPTFDFQLSPEWTTSGIEYPTPQKIISNLSSKISFGYEKQALFPFKIETREPQSLDIKVSVQYLVCKLQCIPESFEFTALLQHKSNSSREEKITPDHSLLTTAYEKLPKPASNEGFTWSDTWIAGNELHLKFSKMPWSISDFFVSREEKSSRRPLKVDIEKVSDDEWAIRHNESAQPLEWTITSRDEKSAFASSTPQLSNIAPSLWIILLFSLLGGFILNFMPCVLPVIFLKTNSLLRLKAKNAFRHSSLLTSLGVITSFIGLGLLTTLLQKWGHNIGWGFQFQSPGFLIFMIIVLTLFGLYMLDFFQLTLPTKLATKLASFSSPFNEGVLATLLATPCSAPFVGTAISYGLSQPPLILMTVFLFMGIGLSTPYILLALFPATLKLLPKPGLWMEYLKKFLAVSLFVTAAWLGSVLYTISQPKSPTMTVEQIETRLEQGEKLFVVVTADWCLTCKFNEETIIHTPWFESLMKKNNISLATLDWTQHDSSITSFLRSHQRSAIPFAGFFSKSKSIILPELLSKDNVTTGLNEFQSD